MMRTDQIATDTGSIIDGDEATRLGLIDKIGGLGHALDTLTELISKRAIGN
jgi:ClpP class serine protease